MQANLECRTVRHPATRLVSSFDAVFRFFLMHSLFWWGGVRICTFYRVRIVGTSLTIIGTNLMNLKPLLVSEGGRGYNRQIDCMNNANRDVTVKLILMIRGPP